MSEKMGVSVWASVYTHVWGQRGYECGCGRVCTRVLGVSENTRVRVGVRVHACVREACECSGGVRVVG